MKQFFASCCWPMVILAHGVVWADAGGATQSDCPNPGDLLSGVALRCGENVIVGTLSPTELRPCTDDGQVTCITSESLPAIDSGAVDASDVKLGVTLGGVEGTYRNEIDADSILACIADGQAECAVTNAFAALSLEGLGDKVLAGEIVAGVSGLATLESVDHCASDRQTSCLAVPDFPAIQAVRLDKCLAEGS